MRSSNPALSEEIFQKPEMRSYDGNVMTISGTVTKTFILLMMLIVPAYFVYNLMMTTETSGSIWMYGGMIGGLILAMVTIFKKEWSPFTAPLYALAEGLFIGAISAYFAAEVGGIVFQAASLTMMTLLSMLALYMTGVIKVTEKFKMGVMAATGGIFLVYLVSWILGMFGVNVGFLHDNGWMGIGISLFVIGVAALNLVMDFDFIEQGANAKAPKYMEWYGAFGLIVTLVWLYIEFLRLLSKLNRD